MRLDNIGLRECPVSEQGGGGSISGQTSVPERRKEAEKSFRTWKRTEDQERWH